MISFPRANVLAASLCLLSLTFTNPAYSSGDGDVGIYGSVTTSQAARSAAQALRRRDWSAAQTEYKKALGFDSAQEDFYYGLYESSRQLKQWDHVARALEELFKKKPSLKNELSFEYGECLYNLNRFDEAEPLLKQSLSKVDRPSVVDHKLVMLIEKGDPPNSAPEVGRIIAWTEPEKPVIPPRNELAPEKIDEGSLESLTFLNAVVKCECIVIAEFKGFSSKSPVSFHQPPEALYKIEQILKGPPLNKSLPVTYEFHEHLRGQGKPEDWKWDPKMMPSQGSRWILFIENGVPFEGAFGTFHGSFGRQELNEGNLDKVHRIIQEHQGQAK